jgi:hypothetical protein
VSASADSVRLGRGACANVTFTIHTGAPGSFSWRCYDPCGDGTTGWGTAMAAVRGYMEGTLTIA